MNRIRRRSMEQMELLDLANLTKTKRSIFEADSSGESIQTSTLSLKTNSGDSGEEESSEDSSSEYDESDGFLDTLFALLEVVDREEEEEEDGGGEEGGDEGGGEEEEQQQEEEE